MQFELKQEITKLKNYLKVKERKKKCYASETIIQNNKQ